MKCKAFIPIMLCVAFLAVSCGQKGADKAPAAKKEPAKEEKEPAAKAPAAPEKAGRPEAPAVDAADAKAAPEASAVDVKTAPEAAPDTQAAAADAAATGEPAAAREPADAPEEPAAAEEGGEMKALSADEIRERQKQYAPVRITWNKELLTDQEKELVQILVRAARVIDHIFWMQATPSGLDWRKELAQKRDPDSRALFHYLMVNYGPYDRLAGMEPFVGEKQRPKGGNYYPTDLTKEEFEKWLEAHPEDAEAFKSTFTVIRREGDKLVAVPYSKAYERELQAAHRLLLQASNLAQNESLKTYLKSRAEAFLSDDYYQSDKDWMDLDSKIEVTIGPYEVYEDHLFGYKAAFEAFVTVKDPEATARLETFKKWLDKLERHLPIPDEHKNFKRGKSSPMPVVDVIFTAGDTRAGVQTIAFNLPNDERVREEKGSKKVMLRNVGAAKFRQILRPIAQRVLVENLQPLLHEDAYFNHTLLHEISHGLGPGTITKDGRETTVNRELKEIYSHLEEAKADILGLYNALYLIDQGVVKLPALEEGKPVADKTMSKEEAKQATLATFLAGIFRSTRFGVDEAHGKANLLIFNYLLDKGAFTVNEEGRFAFDETKAPDAVRDMAHELLMIQALGDYEQGKAFIAKYGEVGEPMRKALAGLDHLPVDIEPIYELP